MRGAPLRLGGSPGLRAWAQEGPVRRARRFSLQVTRGLSRLWRAPLKRQIFSGARGRLRGGVSLLWSPRWRKMEEIEREGEPGFATKTRALAADLPKNAA